MIARTLTEHQRRQRIIARARDTRAADLSPLRAEVMALVAAVGWDRARPIVVEVMSPVKVSGPSGVWRSRIGKRTGARLVTALSVLPVQERLPLPISERRPLAGRTLGTEGKRP